MAYQLTHATVFTRPKKWDIEAIYMTPRTLKVLARVNGISTVEDISMLLDLSLPDVIVEITNLLSNDLIFEVAEDIDTIEIVETGSSIHDNSHSSGVSSVF